jgi:hypothetical protein
MTGMPADLKAGVLLACKTAPKTRTRPAVRRAGSDGAPADRWEPAKAQAREIHIGLELGNRRIADRPKTDAKRRDLRRFGPEVSRDRYGQHDRRHWLTDRRERLGKLRDETGFDSRGELAEPPLEQWTRPDAMPLYHRLMLGDDGAASVDLFTGEDLTRIAWLTDEALLDVTSDGRIHLLSDCDQVQRRRYPGAPVSDAQAKLGRNLAGRLYDLVRGAWAAIVAGRPGADIDVEHRRRMRSKYGVRISIAQLTYQVNRAEHAARSLACSCMRDDGTKPEITERGHAEGCPCNDKWASRDAVLRTVHDLMDAGEMQRTDDSYMTRVGHTVIGVPAAYHVPADAGWHAYAAAGSPVRRHRKPSKLRRSLLTTAS